MASTLKLGKGNWGVKEDSLLAYSDQNNNFVPLPFDFSRAPSATVVNKAGLVESVTSGLPRIDFSDDTNGALLLEPQSTNLITYSSDYSNGWGYFDASTNANALISPSGVLDASKFIEGSGSSIKRIINLSQSIVSGNDYTFSIFAKKGERDFITLTNNTGTADVTTTFDLTNGTVTSGIGSISSFANGWFKCSRSFTATATVTSAYIAQAFVNNGSGISYQGDGASGIYIWGAMLEQQSYATSYIPTAGATATRVQEICVGAGNASTFNSTEGVLYAEIAALADDGTNRLITLSKSSDWSNRTFLRYDPSVNLITYRYLVNGSIKVNLVHTLSDATILNKIACKWELNNFKLYVNGLNVGQDISGSVMGANSLDTLKFNNGLNTQPFYGKTKDLKVYPTALSDAELATLTTI